MAPLFWETSALPLAVFVKILPSFFNTSNFLFRRRKWHCSNEKKVEATPFHGGCIVTRQWWRHEHCPFTSSPRRNRVAIRQRWRGLRYPIATTIFSLFCTELIVRRLQRAHFSLISNQYILWPKISQPHEGGCKRKCLDWYYHRQCLQLWCH